LCIPFATKIPYEELTEIRAVGNAANAAIAVARIGLSSAFITWVGDDESGKRQIETLRERGVADEFVTIEKNKKTNCHFVLTFGPERTILIKHEAFTCHLPTFAEPPKWMYFSSIAETAKEFHHEVAAYVVAHPETKLAFQPGTFQIKMGAEELKDVYAVSEIFFCNKEEAQLILQTKETDIKKLMEGIHALGPKIVVVTDGPNGSNILDTSGAWHVPMYPDPAPPVSRTGAGDATSATTVAYIIKGLEPKDALMRGLINAAAGVQAVHVQLGTLTDEKIEEWYAKRPLDFVATNI
jgi:sugar/nucleoside kinase (ribokinase family)